MYVQGKPSAGQIFMLPCMARSELFEESFSFGDFGCVLCCAFVGRVMKQIQRFAWSRGTFADIRSFEDILKVSQGLKPQAHIPANQHSSVASSRLVAPVPRNVLVRFVQKVRLSAAASHEAGPQAPASI